MSDYRLVTGTFVDAVCADIPSQNWSRSDWAAQFDVMKAMGMDTVVIIRVGFKDSAAYRSEVMKTPLQAEPDVLRMIFEEADRTGLKVYCGLFDSARHCSINDWGPEVAVNLDLIDEVWERYGGHKSFHGWYQSHESPIVRQHMVQIWRPLGEKMRRLDPAKRILISPRYEGVKYGTPNPAPIPPALHAKHLEFVLQQVADVIDEAAFMDGHAAFSELEAYVKVTAEVCRKHDVAFWSNLETFDRDMAWRFPPIEWTKMRFKMDVVQPYVEKIITFEAPHFLSPLSMFPSAGKLYERYMEFAAECG